MLKIQTLNKNGHIRLLVEGRLVNGWITVLRNCWNECRLVSKDIQVEFLNIPFAAKEARKLLREMSEAGTRLTAREVYMKAILKEIEMESVPSGETI